MTLSAPTRELADRILAEVEFEHRMTGARVREHAGPMSQTMYSFAEIHGLLTDREPRMDFARLESWIRTVMRDAELADQVAEAIKVGSCGADQAWRIRDLMGERLSQCRELVAAAEAERAPLEAARPEPSQAEPEQVQQVQNNQSCTEWA